MEVARSAVERPAQRRRAGDGLRYRLVRHAPTGVTIEPSAEQRHVIEHDKGRLKVLAGPGTGKTATLAEAVADRIERRGVVPSSILVLTFSRRAAAELTARVARRLKVTTSEPIVRTLHSYAYALVRQATPVGQPQPRLLDAGQADIMVRDILAGHADAGGGYWPAGLHAALRTSAFAAELRELMLRAAERQVSPREIARLAQRRRRPEWAAVARFIQEYRDIGDLRTGTTGLGAKLDQAELTTAALERLELPEILAAQRNRVRRLFVDEYQDVDPAQAALVELLAGGADELVVAGDPDQSIYAFRGAETGALARIATDETVDLTVSRRLPATLVTATRRVAAHIPGPSSHRQLTVTPGDEQGDLEIRTLPNAHREAAFIADRFRRLHLGSGLPFSEMAIITRSPAQSGEVLRRALTAAGLPVTLGATAPLAEEPLVAALLTVLRAGVDPASLDGDAAIALLTSPLGGLDVLTVRRLRRALRATEPTPGERAGRSGDRLADILTGRREVPPGLAPDLDRPLRELIGLVAIARGGRLNPAARDVLWQVWDAARLESRLMGAYEQGGDEARRAARHLDAAVALFDQSADLAAQLPSAGVVGLLDLIAHEQLRTDQNAAGGGHEDAVTITSAHAAKGMEWDAVAVAAVQDESWPDLRPRSSLLGSADLLDAAADIDAPVPPASPLADERRLFYVAVTRARRRLIVTAVDNAETSPSRFIYELAGTTELTSGWPRDARGRESRGLNLPELVAELRAAVSSEPEAPAEAGASARAARVLAMLSREGVRGADPRSWYGLADLTSDRALVEGGDAVTLSPSQVESLMQCPLRTALDRNGGRPEAGQAQLVGMAVHALAEGMALGAGRQDTDAAIEEFLAAQGHLPPWEVLRLRRRMQAMREALETWLAEHDAARTLIGAEIPLDVEIPGDGDGVRPVRLRGRLDWVSRDSDGRVVITDFKTGATVPSAADAQEHPQLAVYQVAVALGALAGVGGDDAAAVEPHGAGVELGGAGVELGGAELVYVATGTPRIRQQAPQSAADRDRWSARLRSLAGDTVGPTLTARAGEYCARCPVRSSCPLQPEGRQVTRARREYRS